MKYMLIHPDAKRPSKSRDDDACYDLYTPTRFDLHPLEVRTIDTGFACEVPKGKWAKIYGRSKLAKRGLLILGGVIDNYRGSWGVVLVNLGKETISFSVGDAIAQFALHERIDIDSWKEGQLSESNRGTEGIWSDRK